MPTLSRGTQTSNFGPLQRVDDRLGDVLGLQDLDRPRLGQARAELGVDDGGHHDGDLDAGVAQLRADGLRDADDEVLGPAIGGAAREPGLARLRGEVDEVAAAAALHARQGQLHPVHHPVHVDVDQPLGGHVVLVDEAPEGHDPGVVDEHVERSEALLDLIEEALEGIAAGDVELEGDRLAADLGCGALGKLAVQVADRDLGALQHQRPRGRPPDPASTAGDRHDLALQHARLRCHRNSLSSVERRSRRLRARSLSRRAPAGTSVPLAFEPR